MERSRSRSQSFYEDEEDADIDNDNAQQARTPMPDFNMLADMDTEEPPPAPGGDDVDTELDDVDQAQDDRRRSRSFFDQTDVACGLKSALPPPEPTGKLFTEGRGGVMTVYASATMSKEARPHATKPECPEQPH